MGTSDATQARNPRADDRIFPPSVIYILGAPAVGKYTVAKAIAECSGAVVVDNQLINQPIMSLFAEWPDSQATTRMWAEIEVVRDAVLRMIEEVVPRSVSYILTNALEDAAEDHALYHRIRAMAVQRGSTFLLVILTCELEESLRRIPHPTRTARFKIDDPARARSYIESTRFFRPSERAFVTYETTSMAPDITAELILAELLY